MRRCGAVVLAAVCLGLLPGAALAGKVRSLMTPPIGATQADRGFCQVANGGTTPATVTVVIYRSTGEILLASEATIDPDHSASFGSGTHLTQFCKVSASGKVLKRLRVSHTLQTPTGDFVANVQAY